MKFVHVGSSSAYGTSYQGVIETTYDRLEYLFGDPLRKFGWSDTIWILRFEDDTVATIYNNSDLFKSAENWSIGGNSIRSVNLVNEIINAKK